MGWEADFMYIGGERQTYVYWVHELRDNWIKERFRITIDIIHTQLHLSSCKNPGASQIWKYSSLLGAKTNKKKSLLDVKVFCLFLTSLTSYEDILIPVIC